MLDRNHIILFSMDNEYGYRDFPYCFLWFDCREVADFGEIDYRVLDKSRVMVHTMV